MKILHTADWHLGKRLDNFSRLDEQKEVLEEICTMADKENVDAVLIAGDLFDTFNPPTEAVELFYKTLKKLSNDGKRAVIAIAGNHDSPDRIEAPNPLARECGIIFVGFPNTIISPLKLDTGLEIIRSDVGFVEVKLPSQEYPLRLILTPYANEYRLKTFLGIDNSLEELRKILTNKWEEITQRYCDNKGVNILLAHLYFMRKGSEMPEEPDDEKPILHIGGTQAIYSENIPAQIQYVALGHLHRQQVMDTKPCPVVYSSSPLAYSFSEAFQDKYVVIINVSPVEQAKYFPVKLTKGKKLLRSRFESIDKAVEWLNLNQNALVELTIVTDKFLTAQERKQLYNVHNGIVAIIPEVKDQSLIGITNAGLIDLSQDIERLFKQYFKHKYGQKPNEELIELFKEVLSEEPEQ